MKKRNLFFYCTLFLTLSVLILLATGSTLLNVALDSSNSIPLGTLITWVGMLSFPLMIYWSAIELRKPSNTFYKILSGFLKLIIVLGILWVPLSYLLAGNLSFSFSEKVTFQGGQTAMRWFWRLSYGIGIGSILTIIVYWVSLLFKKK